jgi:muramoyltetrapeptide carboxypeptidase
MTAPPPAPSPAPLQAPPRVPPPLAPGARVALVAPAGPLRGPDDLARADANVRSLGWEPVVGRHALAHRAYFAGDDADRLADLNAALADPAIDAVWCLRGGYGAMRLLDAVDWAALAGRPRALIGYSDITALHAAAAARVPGLVTFHGPTARATLTPFSRASLARALMAAGDPCGDAPDARVLRPGRAAGWLAGGNLALLAALAGTPYLPSLRGALLVLEDVHEATYRIDRMLRTLLLGGALDGCAGIVAGQFTDCPEHCDDDGRRTLAEVIGEVAAALDVPAVLDVPIGHVDDQWTLPLGAPAVLEAGETVALRVTWPAAAGPTT